ncbi:uncharacterized protein SCHCODRAFT_02703463 [Schizophyllum commune H4-8]|uniref:Uncharacterized protein n=1 Tax=Schizophyllum commune (strain H4-8 / FGSC 9210) TaxID=578458 RepID=D8QB22_SCHCM|nr:uncharacterized protein SCHCODRAFT_02703463 [Schizophyllum commune H4-8]KAI5889005.1 hypothetical protein SCHCODRAFT_02703463 [Schizophyllum commune H4-8]
MPVTRSSSARRQTAATASAFSAQENCRFSHPVTPSTATTVPSRDHSSSPTSSTTSSRTSASASSSTSHSRRVDSDSTSRSSSKPTLTEAQRETAFALSPAVDAFTTAEIRCAYCRRIFKLPCRDNNGAFDSANFKRHLVRAHQDEAKGRRVTKGSNHELMVYGLAPAPMREGERPLQLGVGCEDHVRRGAGAAEDPRVAEIERALREVPEVEAKRMENNLYWFATVCELVRAI